jgi:hypothetical protein
VGLLLRLLQAHLQVRMRVLVSQSHQCVLDAGSVGMQAFVVHGRRGSRVGYPGCALDRAV